MAENRFQMSARDYPDRFDVRAPRGDVVMTYERDGDRLCVTDLVVHWEPRRPLDELGTVDMTAFATVLAELYGAGMVIDRAGEALGQRGLYEFLDSAEHVAAARQARAVARQAARPRRPGAKIEDGFLKEVAQRFDDVGSRATWEYYGVNERTLRRWLKLAKDRVGWTPPRERS